MAEAEYSVVGHGSEWHVVFDGLPSTPYPSQGIALDAAIDQAELMGQSGKPACVSIEADGKPGQVVWTYGKDPYPPPRG
jgi:hypothetical protein